VRFINRQRGSGTRFLLDCLLEKEAIDPERINGYEQGEYTHAAVAAYVASGMADAGFGVETPARRFKLDFIPLQTERYFLLCEERMIETPVSGSSGQVRNGEGTGLIGGERDTVDSVADIIDALYPKWFYMGEAGNGGRAKLAINHLLGLNRLVLAEGLVFAESLGLDPKGFLDVARQSAAYAQVMDIKGPKMVSGDYTPQGFIHQSLKDFKLIIEQAGKRGQEMPLATLNAEVLAACVSRGESERDNAAVIEEIKRRKKPSTPT